MCVERNSRLPIAYGRKQEEPAINYTMSVIEHGIEHREKGETVQKKKRPWQGEANKAQRQELVRYLVGQAEQRGYLLATPETPKLATDHFRHWCKQALHPAITVELQGACTTIIADTGPVGKGLEAQGRLWRSDPWPTLAATPDLQAQLTRLAEYYLSRSPYQAMFFRAGRDETILKNILAEDAEQAVHDLLTLWSQAMAQYEVLLETRHRADISETHSSELAEPAWMVALKQAEEQAETAMVLSFGDTLKVPERLSTLLSKVQICAFLGLPTKTKERKAILVQQLRTLLEADQRAKARFFHVFAQELAVEPWELETLLGCSTTERKQWLADGKLTPLTTRSIFKSGRKLIFPVFDRSSIQRLTQKDLEGWRAEHAALVAMRRKTGAQKASSRRVQNEQARQNEFAMVESLFSEWEQHEFPELAAVFRLAYWTMWASRWAKENHVKGIKAVKHQALYEQRRERWYARKDEALSVLANSSYARIAFYRPDQADKIILSLCDGHCQSMKQGFYEGKRDFYVAHTKEIKACPGCHVTIELDYYSLYSLEIVADVRPDMRFAFHIPYLAGLAFLPPPHSLPHVTQAEQEDGLFRFGRRLEEGEKFLYREKDVETQFTQALTEARRLFSSVEPSSFGEKKAR